MKNKKLIVSIIVSIAICLIVGFTTGFVTRDAITEWYAYLDKPAFNPPNWVFGPAWTVLYILMGTAAGIIFNKGWQREDVRVATVLFAVQLALNGLWSIIFFGLRNPALAFIEIIALWALIIFCTYKFFKISRTAGWLMIPYLLWVSFAKILNLCIWQMN